MPAQGISKSQLTVGIIQPYQRGSNLVSFQIWPISSSSSSTSYIARTAGVSIAGSVTQIGTGADQNFPSRVTLGGGAGNAIWNDLIAENSGTAQALIGLPLKYIRDFEAFVGFFDNGDTGEQLFVGLQDASVNSGVNSAHTNVSCIGFLGNKTQGWVAVVSNGTQFTTAVLNVGLDLTPNNIHKFQFQVIKQTGGGFFVKFYIDGVFLATITQTFPTVTLYFRMTGYTTVNTFNARGTISSFTYTWDTT